MIDRKVDALLALCDVAPTFRRKAGALRRFPSGNLRVLEARLKERAGVKERLANAIMKSVVT